MQIFLAPTSSMPLACFLPFLHTKHLPTRLLLTTVYMKFVFNDTYCVPHTQPSTEYDRLHLIFTKDISYYVPAF